MPGIEQTAARLTELLTMGSKEIGDPRAHPGAKLTFMDDLVLRPLTRLEAPLECWAVDGGQCLVADARCLQVYTTRAARVRMREGACDLEDEGELAVHLLGGTENRRCLEMLGSPVSPESPVDVNLLRDWGEWSAVSRCIEDAEAGSIVLIDGDLQPDWRIPSSWLAALLERAAEREVTLVGITKHSSLARGGAPLIGQLEQEGESAFGPRTCWWAPVASCRSDIGAGITVSVAKLDPDARFAFRIDTPAGADTEQILGHISALCDDAAFPGYPYPLSVADRLAACPSWVRDDLWDQLMSSFETAGISTEVTERAFADRHTLMERS